MPPMFPPPMHNLPLRMLMHWSPVLRPLPTQACACTHYTVRRTVCPHLPFPCESTACLYVPAVVLDGGEVEVLRDLGSRHGALHVLLVGKDQHMCPPKLLYTGERDHTQYRNRVSHNLKLRGTNIHEIILLQFSAGTYYEPK